jgi:hypothetical protein
LGDKEEPKKTEEKGKESDKRRTQVRLEHRSGIAHTLEEVRRKASSIHDVQTN